MGSSLGLAGPGVAELQTLDLALAEDLVDLDVGMDLDLRVLQRPVDHDLAGAERVAPMEQVDLGREAGQVGRLLEGGVATTDDGDLAVLEEEAVTGRARAHAAAPQARLRRRGPSHRAEAPVATITAWARYSVPRAQMPERALGEVDPVDVDIDHPGTEALRLGAHRGHQLRALDAVGEARVVLDVAGQHQLAAGRRARQDDRLEVGPRGVDGRGQAGRPGADDDDLGVDPALAAGDGGRSAGPGQGRGVGRRVDHRDREATEWVRRGRPVLLAHGSHRITGRIPPGGIAVGQPGRAWRAGQDVAPDLSRGRPVRGPP